MKSYFLSMLLALAALVSAPAQSRAPQSDTIGPDSRIQVPPAGTRFPNGQSLVYDAEWRLWTAGTATLTIDPNGNSQRVVATATSTGVVAVLYTVRDRFESSFDPRTFCSERIYKHTEEGSHLRDSNIRFDYTRKKAVLDEKNLKKNEAKHAEEDIPSCVTDVVSGIFYVGSLPLQPGATYSFPLNDGGKVVDVRATVEGREQIKTAAGTYNTVRVRTEANSGPLKKRGSIWFWYSEDSPRLPVQMRARAFWGTLTLKLARLEAKR